MICVQLARVRVVFSAGPGVDLGHKVGCPVLGADGSAAHWSRDEQPPRAQAVHVSGPQASELFPDQ